MVITSPDLYTELGVKRLSEAEVVLTADLNLEDYIVFLERQERKIKGITEKPIILIDAEDFEDVHQKYKRDQIHLLPYEESPYGQVLSDND